MKCTLYSSDGPVMSEGTCEATETGIKMTAHKWHTTPTVGGLPLALVMEDGGRTMVRVENVHVVQSDPQHGHVEVYDFTPLGGDDDEKKGGLLSSVKSLFGKKDES